MTINDQGVQCVENRPMEEIKEQLKEQLCNSPTSPQKEKKQNNHQLLNYTPPHFYTSFSSGCNKY